MAETKKTEVLPSITQKDASRLTRELHAEYKALTPKQKRAFNVLFSWGRNQMPELLSGLNRAAVVANKASDLLRLIEASPDAVGARLPTTDKDDNGQPKSVYVHAVLSPLTCCLEGKGEAKKRIDSVCFID